MKFAELKQALSAGIVKPFYYLTGSDEYLKTSAVGLLKKKTAMPEFNYARYEEPDAKTLIAALTAMPLMSEYRVVLADNFGDFAGLSEYIVQPNPNSVLILRATAVPKKKTENEKAYAKFLAAAEEIDCNPMPAETVYAWMSVEGKKRGITVSGGAAELLYNYLRGDMSRISSEFNKLAAYKTDGTITPDDIKNLVEPDAEYSVWQLSAAVAKKDAALAIKAYMSFDDDAKKPEVLFGALYNHFRKLFYAACKSDEGLLKKTLGISDKALYMIRGEAKKFGPAALKNILLSFAEADDDLKSGAIDRNVAAETLIIKIIMAQ